MAIAAAVVLAGLGLAVVPKGAATARIVPFAPGAANSPVPAGQAAAIPAGARDLGAAAPAGQLQLDLVLKPRDPAALEQFATAVSTPGSPLYRDYLAPGQFGPEFGPAPATIAAVRTAVAGLGLRAGQASSGGLVVPASGTVAQVDRALGTSERAFRLASGQVAVANVTAPQLPAAIAPDIQAIVGLDTLPVEEPAVAAEPAASAAPAAARQVPGEAVPCAAAIASGGQTAPDIAQAYDMDPLYAAGDFGAGERVDAVEFAPFDGNTIANYQKCYGLSVPLRAVPVDGGPGGSVDQPNANEDEIDIEDLASLMPQASSIDVFEAPNTAKGQVDILAKIQAADSARAVSDSWVGCEPAMISVAKGEEPILALMAAQGQSFFVATGDRGSQQCGPSKLAVADPASQPWVTAVGGTNLNGLGAPPAVAPSEDAWSKGGGGISTLWQMQSWQPHNVPGVINKYSSNAPCKAPSGQYCRELPDVSADAGIGYAVLFGGSGGRWGAIGGTSLAAPTWAAITLLADDSSAGCRKKAVGFINPGVYKLLVSTPADFNGITTGNNTNGNPAVNGAYPATAGYDLATGLGTPEAANLAQSWCGGSYWTPETAITPPQSMPTPNGGTPATTSSNGVLYVAYTDTADHIDYMTFNGTKWNGPSTVAPGGVAATTTDSPAIAVSNGSLWAAWTTSGGQVDASSLQSSGWTAAAVVGAGQAQSSAGPALAAGAGSEVWATWKDSGTSNVYLSTDSGKGWQAQIKVPGASTPSGPAITYHPSAQAAVIAWQTSSDTIKYQVHGNGNSGFGGVGTIPGKTSKTPALTVLGKRLYAAWTGAGTVRIFYSYQPEGYLGAPWSGQAAQPQARTLTSPQISGSRSTLFTTWNGTGGQRFWYAESDTPQ